MTSVPWRPIVHVVFCLCVCGAAGLLSPDDTNVITCRANWPDPSGDRDEAGSHRCDAQLRIAAVMKESVWKSVDARSDAADVGSGGAAVVKLSDHFAPQCRPPAGSHAFLSPLRL